LIELFSPHGESSLSFLFSKKKSRWLSPVRPLGQVAPGRAIFNIEQLFKRDNPYRVGIMRFHFAVGIKKRCFSCLFAFALLGDWAGCGFPFPPLCSSSLWMSRLTEPLPLASLGSRASVRAPPAGHFPDPSLLFVNPLFRRTCSAVDAVFLSFAFASCAVFS